MKSYNFEATIKKNKDMDAGYIEVPIDIEKDFGVKRLKVKAKFDGYEYRGSIVRMGTPCYIIGVTKEIRNNIGKSYGDTIKVEIQKDDDLREIIISTEFREKLELSDSAHEFYHSLSFSQQKKYNNWIESAKKKETKDSRIAKAIRNLENKLKMS